MIERLPHDTTKTFTEIFESKETFLSEWKESGLYEEGLVKDSSITKTFFHLYAKFGNSAIANWDIEQFKYKVWSTIFKYAPSWEKRLEIQAKFRGLSEEELMKGNKQIFNHAFNPSTDPSTCTLEEILTVNDQNTTNIKRSKIEAYAMLNDLIETDVTEAYLERFRPLFATFVYTKPDLFVTEED